MMPASRIATISSEVATGRRMNWRDGFMRLGFFRARESVSPAALPWARRSVARRSLATGTVATRRPRPRGGGSAARLRFARDELDLRPFTQLVGAIDDDHVARGDAAVDRRHLTLHGSQLDGADADRAIIVDDKHERPPRAALSRRRPDGRRIRTCLDSH